MTAVRRIVALAVAVVTVAGAWSPASAQSAVTGPSVTADRTEVNVGDQVILTMTNFEAGSVVMAVCGNEGRRGSVDCNLPASRAKELSGPTTATSAQLTIAEPPAPCPCVIRVSSQGDSEIAIAPITISGLEVAPVVEPSSFENPLEVSISARQASQGLSKGIRSSLGGATAYEVTVTVRNRSTANVERVAVAGSAGHGADDNAVDLELGAPQSLAAGQTWQQVVTAELPSPVFGDYTWKAVASGAGPPVTATAQSSHTPVLFWVLVVFLVVDLVVLAIRFVVKRVRRRRTPPSVMGRPKPIDPAAFDQAVIDKLLLDARESEFV